MKCKLCQTTPKDWDGDDRVCAFPDGIFSDDNWNCATANKLRDLAENYRVYGDDQSIAVIPIPKMKEYNSGWLVLNWYKNRGCTSIAQVISYGTVVQLRIKQAEEIIKYLSPLNIIP